MNKDDKLQDRQGNIHTILTVLDTGIYVIDDYFHPIVTDEQIKHFRWKVILEMVEE